MKKYTFIIALTIISMGCKAQTIETKSEKMLIGKATKQDLQQEPFATWFTLGEQKYKPKSVTIEALKKATQDYSVTIFMGTWCGDSKEQVPHFFKILSEIGFDLNKVQLIAMTKEKTTPQKLESGQNITNVPTFILFRNGKEIKRIVETPVISLEEDLLKIVTGQAYKHNYE